VHLTEHESAAMREIIHPAYHLVLYVLPRSVRKHILGIAASPSEGEVRAELPLQPSGIHIPHRNLYRIQHIDTALYYVRY